MRYIFNEQTMKPLNKKLIPYSKAFKQVSKVLGKEEALKQLGLVWDCPDLCAK